MSNRTHAKSFSVSLGLELYMVQQAAERDLPGTLASIFAMGYREVELPPYLDWTASDIIKAIKDAGLRCPSICFTGDQLQKDLEACIEYTGVVGADYLVLAAPTVADSSRLIPQDFQGNVPEAYSRFFASFTMDDWKWNAELLNTIGSRVKGAGLQLAYHNHCMEFRRFGSQTAYEFLLATTEPDFVALEMDCGWVQHAGLYPAELLKRYTGRIKMLHLKDILRSSGPSTDIFIQSTEFGTGCIDWNNVLTAAKNAGVQHYFVEQEPPLESPLDSALTSYKYLRALDHPG